MFCYHVVRMRCKLWRRLLSHSSHYVITAFVSSTVVKHYVVTSLVVSATVLSS